MQDIIAHADLTARRGEEEHMENKMAYTVVMVTGGTRQKIAEVVSEGWAETFAEDIRNWIKECGGDNITKVVVEEK